MSQGCALRAGRDMHPVRNVLACLGHASYVVREQSSNVWDGVANPVPLRGGIEGCAASIFLDFAKLHRGYLAFC